MYGEYIVNANTFQKYIYRQMQHVDSGDCIINTQGHLPASALCMRESQTSQQCNTYWGQKRQWTFKLMLSVK